MANIQVPPDSTGKLVETVQIASSGMRQVVVIGSPTSTSGLAQVTSSGGLGVTILAGAGAGSTAVNITNYSGAGASVTSSAGIMTNISSGTVALSGSINVLTTGTLAVVSASSGFNQIFVTGSSGGAAVVTSSGGLAVTIIAGGAASATISSSSIVAVYQSTGTVYTPFLFNSSSSASLIVITTSAKMLYGWNVASQSSQQSVIRLYNSTGPTVGSTSLLIHQIPIPGSSVGAGSNLMLQSGINFSSAMSLVIIDNFITTSTAVTQHVGGDIIGTLYIF